MARKPMLLLKACLLIVLASVTLSAYSHGCYVYLGSRCGSPSYVYKTVWVPGYRYHCCWNRGHYARIAVPVYKGPYCCCHYKGPCGCQLASVPCHWNTYGNFDEGYWLVHRGGFFGYGYY